VLEGSALSKDIPVIVFIILIVTAVAVSIKGSHLMSTTELTSKQLARH
jgi:hypothetical protein